MAESVVARPAVWRLRGRVGVARWGRTMQWLATEACTGGSASREWVAGILRRRTAGDGATSPADWLLRSGDCGVGSAWRGGSARGGPVARWAVQGTSKGAFAVKKRLGAGIRPARMAHSRWRSALGRDPPRQEGGFAVEERALARETPPGTGTASARRETPGHLKDGPDLWGESGAQVAGISEMVPTYAANRGHKSRHLQDGPDLRGVCATTGDPEPKQAGHPPASCRPAAHAHGTGFHTPVDPATPTRPCSLQTAGANQRVT